MPFDSDSMAQMLDDLPMLRAVINAYTDFPEWGFSKKLKSAATHWCKGGGVFEESTQELLDQGLDLADKRAPKGQKRLKILRCGKRTGRRSRFLLSARRNGASMSGLVGLDYTAVAWVLRLNQVEDELLTLQKLQIVEATVLKLMNGNRSE